MTPETDAIVAAFDDHADHEYSITDAATLRELRAAAAAARREAAVPRWHGSGTTWRND